MSPIRHHEATGPVEPVVRGSGSRVMPLGSGSCRERATYLYMSRRSGSAQAVVSNSSPEIASCEGRERGGGKDNSSRSEEMTPWPASRNRHPFFQAA